MMSVYKQVKLSADDHRFHHQLRHCDKRSSGVPRIVCLTGSKEGPTGCYTCISEECDFFILRGNAREILTTYYVCVKRGNFIMEAMVEANRPVPTLKNVGIQVH